MDPQNSSAVSHNSGYKTDANQSGIAFNVFLTRKIFLILFFLFSVFCPTLSASAEVLTWRDCLREAAQHHPDLISAHEDIIQSQAAKGIAAAGQKPDLSVNAGASTGQSDAAGSSQSYSYGVSASQLLFDGAKTLNSVHAAQEGVKAAQYGFRFASAEIRFRLRQAFVNLLKAQAMLELTDDIHLIRKSNLELIALRYESGTEHQGALLSAKASLSQAVFEKNAAQRNLVQVQRQLLKELGRQEYSPISVEGSLDDTAAPLKTPDFAELAQLTPGLLRIGAQKNAAEFNIKSRRGEFWPEILLRGQASKSEDQWPPQDEGTTANVAVTLPLFSGGINAARLTQARSVYRQLEQDERSLRDGIILELQENWNGFIDAVERVGVQKDIVAANEERAKIAQAQYSVGLISFDNWTIIEDSLVSGRKTFLDVRAAALIAEANWIQAKGETLEYEN